VPYYDARAATGGVQLFSGRPGETPGVAFSRLPHPRRYPPQQP